MRTLYISDLDGTLLNSEAKLSNKTTSMINHLIENGLLFTIVTARSYKSAIERITPLNLNIPIGFTYGAIAYDPTSKKNLIKNLVPEITTNSIFDLFTQSQLSPTLVHTLDNSEQYRTYYTEVPDNQGAKHYFQDRFDSNDDRFRQINDYSNYPRSYTLEIAIIDKKEKLDPLYNKIRSLPVSCAFYSDFYTPDYNWIAITHDFGNKNWISHWLKSYVNADKIVAFGDSLNDLPLFEAADAKCVVENGVSELKQHATQVIGSNNEDGVANFLAGCMNEKVTK